MTEEKNSDLKVLVIETMGSIRQLMATILAGEYRELLFAEDADDGYRIAMTERPDVIITDDLLPRSGGRNVCERIRGNPDLKSTPVIVTTAWGSSACEMTYFKTGCDQLLRKPFRCEDIRYAIKKALKKRQHEETMVQVLFKSGGIDMVDTQTLDRLISEREILCFRRRDGVAVIGRDPVRSNRSNRHCGPDRRSHTRKRTSPQFPEKRMEDMTL